MPPSPPYRAPCTWQTCTMAQLPQLHARCTNPLQQCFPPQLPISHGSVFRQAAVFRVNHPTLVVAARTRGGKSVHWSWSRIGGEAAPSTISCCPRGGDGGCNCCSVVCAVTATQMHHRSTQFRTKRVSRKKKKLNIFKDIGPAVRPTLIISFGQMNRGEIAAGWDWQTGRAKY